MDRRTMLSRMLAAGAVVTSAPALLSACTRASPAAPEGTASAAGSGAGGAQAPLFTWTRSLPIDSMSRGIGVIGGTELRALAVMDGSLYAGNSYWRDTRRADPALPGAQVLAGVFPTRPYQRVMSFAECNGALYATMGWGIYQRQDGSTPSWTKVFTWGQDLPLNGDGGLRGLTSIADPAGGGQVLLVAAEGPQARLLRIAPGDHFSVTTDLNVVSYASAELHTPVRGLIAAYNNMVPYPPYPSAPQPGASPGSLLIGGYHAGTPQSPSGLGRASIAPDAYLLIRDPHGGYRSQEVLDPAISPAPALVATRTIIVSPFPSDPPGTIYAGGFDAGDLLPHNSAWLYRGTPDAT
jgi:hypothetical protein